MFNYTTEQLNDLVAKDTVNEINQQPKTWLKTISQIKEEKSEIAAFIKPIIDQEDFDVVLTGAGTSEFVGNTLYSYLNKQLNYKVKSFATTDLVQTPENYLSKNKPTLLVSFGRSGNSPESIGAVDIAEVVCTNVRHLFITCNKDGKLSKRAMVQSNSYAINLTPETHDQGFAMTSSFSNMYLATLLIFNLDNLNSIEHSINNIITSTTNFLNNDYDYFKTIVNSYNFNRIVYLGANSLKGVAQESALKMLELTAGQVVTMYDSPLGFRHGPKSIINDDTLIVIYLSDDEYSYKYELDLIKEISAQRKGNKILAISNTDYVEVRNLVDYYYSFSGEINTSILLGLQYIVVAQTIALYKSIILNITPDNPCPSGEVNRVVQGVTLYPYKSEVK